ncbi:unnamed protein product [Lactuca virosa]|uniref:Uncharacterized protein n=1 Tax=Lactuca virosa TaxID=75947 RepID=A0AAU9PKS8_9ASTR|nr:unnamed protein product [Lactuca virosa]
MEACFFSSNSFTKSLEVVIPSIKPGVFVQPKTLSSRIRFRKVGTCSSTTCCQSQSNSPSPSSRDEDNMFHDADWRSFRARLVAGEQALTSQESSPNTTVNPPPSVPIGEKWVHAIHEPEKRLLIDCNRETKWGPHLQKDSGAPVIHGSSGHNWHHN